MYIIIEEKSMEEKIVHVYHHKDPQGYGKMVNKNIALILCVAFGWFGFHKFYEGKGGMGLIYLFTCGLFLFGWIVDIFTILSKPDPYYV